MAKYGDVFPTRTGTPQGGATERKMLDITSGPDGLRTQVRNNPDGSVTMLRTRGGHPEFSTALAPAAPGVDFMPRGLCAYPLALLNTTWSKPCVLVWNTTLSKWDVGYYNPPQTASLVPNPPVFSPIEVTYWTDGAGSTCLVSGSKAFWGGATIANGYSSWSSDTVYFSGALVMPFRQGTDKYIFTQDTEHTKLFTSAGVLVHDHVNTRTYGGEVKTYNIQLPMSVTTDGAIAIMQSAIALRWGIPAVGFYDAEKEKSYWVTHIAFPGSTVVQNEYRLPNFGYFDGAMDTVADAPDSSFGECDGLYVDTVDPVAGGYVFVNHAFENGGLSDAYWVPMHTRVANTDQGTTTFSVDDRGARKNHYTLLKTQTFQIGNLASGVAAAPVYVRIEANLNQLIAAEGRRRVGIHVPTIAYDFHTGETAKNQGAVTVATSNNDTIKISVSVGSLDVVCYEHTGRSSGSARSGSKSYIKGSVNPAYTEGYPDYHETHRIGGMPGDHSGSDTPDPDTVYVVIDGQKFYQTGGPAGPVGVANGWPTYVDHYNLNQNDNVWHTEIEDGSYAGVVSFQAVSRTILAADAALGFVAYVEVSIDAQTGFSAPPPMWSVPLHSPSMTAAHNISVRVVVRYAGTEYALPLVGHVVSKIGIWDRQEIEDWHQWPWDGIVPLSMYLVMAPRMWPDAQKMRQIDNIFIHQGVSQDLAGIPAAEDGTGKVIFAKRFRLKDIGADWLLDEYGITESKRGATEGSPPGDLLRYYYCPDLEPKVEDDFYQVEFDQTGLRAWVGDIPPKTGIVADKDDRDAICYRA